MSVMSTSQTPQQIGLACPYCGTHFEVPPHDKWGTRRSSDVEVMPYTRDIGLFDDGQWTRLGRDFHAGLVTWEDIGILRRADQYNVWYRVATCPNCGNLFDIYANFTQGQTMRDFWPHLFGRGDDGQIESYMGTTATVYRLDVLKGQTGSAWAAAIFAWLLLLLVSFAPRLIRIALISPGISILSGLWSQAGVQLTVRILGGLTLVVLWATFCNYVSFMHAGEGFYDLFAFRLREFTTHWKNFTLARFVGVQLDGRKHALTQVAVLAGMPSSTVCIAAWLTFQSQRMDRRLFGVGSLLLVAVLFLSGYVLSSLCERLRLKRPQPRRGDKWSLRNVFLPADGPRLRGGLVGLAVWGGLIILQLFRNRSAFEVVDGIFELAYWTIIAFYLGLGIQFALNTSTYILRGAERLPMRLDPLSRFRPLEVLERIETYAGVAITSILMLMVALIALQSAPWPAEGTHQPFTRQAFEDVTWLFAWVSLGLVLLFSGLGIISSRLMLLGALGYLAGRAILSVAGNHLAGTVSGMCTVTGQSFEVPIRVGSITMCFPLELGLLGLFLSYVVYFQISQAFGVLRKIKGRAKTEALNNYDAQISRLSETISKATNADDANRVTQLSACLHELIQIRDYIAGLPVAPSIIQNAVRILSPFVSTFVLPIALELMLRQLG